LFLARRDLRAAVFFCFAAIEACINQFIHEHVGRNQYRMNQHDIDKWTEKNGYLSIETKLKEGIKLFGGTPFACDSKLWGGFLALKELRDGLTHFRPSSILQTFPLEFFQGTQCKPSGAKA
jgi:hypothetical protein